MEITPGIRRIGSSKVNVYLIEEAGGDHGRRRGDAGLLRRPPGRARRDGPHHRGRPRRAPDACPQRPHRVRRADPSRARQDDHRPRGRCRARARRVQAEERGRREDPSRSRSSRSSWFGLRRGGLRTKPIAEVSTFGDGATLDVPGSPRVIHVPGHTAGSAALHLPSRNVIFVGDAFVTLNVMSGSTGPQLFPNFNADNQQALASLAPLRRRSRRGTSCPGTARRGSAGWRTPCGACGLLPVSP